MGMSTTAFVETRRGRGDARGGWQTLCELHLDDGEGLELHVLSGLTDDQPSYTVADLSPLAADRWKHDSETIAMSKVMRIDGDGAAWEPLIAKIRDGASWRIQALLQAFRALGADARIVFWYTE
jgi:hypothetical protein